MRTQEASWRSEEQCWSQTWWVGCRVEVIGVALQQSHWVSSSFSGSLGPTVERLQGRSPSKEVRSGLQHQGGPWLHPPCCPNSLPSLGEEWGEALAWGRRSLETGGPGLHVLSHIHCSSQKSGVGSLLLLFYFFFAFELENHTSCAIVPPPLRLRQVVVVL